MFLSVQSTKGGLYLTDRKVGGNIQPINQGDAMCTISETEVRVNVCRGLRACIRALDVDSPTAGAVQNAIRLVAVAESYYSGPGRKISGKTQGLLVELRESLLSQSHLFIRSMASV